MRLLLLLALRHLRARPASALVTVLGVAVGVAGVRAMSLGSDGAVATLRQTFVEVAGPASWMVLPAGDPGAPLPDGTKAWAEAAEGVELVLPAVVVHSVRLEDLRAWFGVVLPEGDAGLVVVGVDPAREAGRGRWRRVAGAADNLGEGRVLVGAAWAESRGLTVGDRLHLLAGDRVLDWEIAGLVAREGLGARAWGRVVIAEQDTVRAGFGLEPELVHELALVTDDDAAPTGFGPGVSLVRPADRGEDVVQKLANLRAATDLLGSVTLLLAALLVAGQFTARAAARAQLLALYRTLGATRTMAAATLLVEAMILAIVGSALGLLVGGPLAHGVAWGLGQGVQQELGVAVLDVAGAMRAFGLGVGVTVLAVGLPAGAAAVGAPLDQLRARPEAARRPTRWWVLIGGGLACLAAISLGLSPPDHSGRSFTLVRVLVGLGGVALCLPAMVTPLVVWSRRWTTTSPVARLGVAALCWRPVRSGLAAGSVALAVALVGGVGAIGAGLRVELDTWSKQALGWDWYLSRPGGFSDADLATIRGGAGVEEARALSVRPLRVEVDDRPFMVSLLALEHDGYGATGGAGLVFMPGEPAEHAAQLSALGDDQHVLVTTVVAAQLGLGVGDTLSVAGREGPLDLVVSGLVVDYTQNGFVIIGSRGLLSRVSRDTQADAVVVRGGDSDTFTALSGVVVEPRRALRERVSTLVDRSLGALDVLLVLGGLVGVMAVAAALAQGAVERRADLVVLRAVGLEPGGVRRMLMVEGLATAGLGVSVGVPLGLGLGWVFARATHTLGIAVPYVPAWGAMFGTVVVVMGVSALAAWIPARRAEAAGDGVVDGARLG